MTRPVRVLAEPTADNPDAPPIYLDAIIDDSDKIAGQRALFGVHGNFQAKDVHFYPFALSVTGQMDYGRGWDDVPGNRHASLNVRDFPIRVGQLLAFRAEWAREWRSYRIMQVFDL